MPQLDILTFKFQIIGTILMFFAIFYFNIWIFLPFFFINLKIKFKLYCYFLKEFFKIKLNLKKLIYFFNFNFIYIINKLYFILKSFKIKLLNIQILYIYNIHNFLLNRFFTIFFKKLLIFIQINNFLEKKSKNELKSSIIFDNILKNLNISKNSNNIQIKNYEYIKKKKILKFEKKKNSFFKNINLINLNIELLKKEYINLYHEFNNKKNIKNKKSYKILKSNLYLVASKIDTFNSDKKKILNILKNLEKKN